MASDQQVIGGWILIIIYASVILFFVIRGALRTKSMQDYALGSVNFSPWFVGLSLAAAMTSAATFVINPGLIAAYGWSALLSFGFFFPLASLLSLVFLTKSFRRFGSSVKAMTLAGWIGSRYQSKPYAVFIAFLSVLLITFIVLILVAITKVLSNALNTNEVYTLLAVIIFVFGYMMFGGANSMVYTNTIQAVVMVIVAVILISSGYPWLKNGLGAFIDQLKAIDPGLVQSTQPSSPLFRSFFEIAVVQMIVGAAVVVQPHIITKSLLLKNERDVNRFLVAAVLIQTLFYSVVLTGLYARLTFPDLSAEGKPLGIDGIIPAYVVQVFSSGWFAITVGLLVIMGLLSAGLSTIEGLIQSLSTTITNDLIGNLLGKQIRNKDNYIKINKFVIVLMAVAAFIASREQLLRPNLSVAIFAQNGVYSFFSINFVPIVFGIFIKNVQKKTVIIGSLTALVVYFTTYYLLPWLIQNQIYSFGTADLYFSGKTQNPAIAAAMAIVFSSALAGFLHIIQSSSKKPIKIENNG